MRRVALTVGPRGSGKSSFCKGFIRSHPSVSLVSRDEILIELFGSTSLNPYAGEHFI